MEKEQVIKALKVCANYQGFGDCDKCPAREGCDAENNFLEREALSLIREQEKRIEELTLENAGFEAGAKAAAKFVRADTVWKMQEAIKERCLKGGVYPAFVSDVVANVARELLEDDTNR